MELDNLIPSRREFLKLSALFSLAGAAPLLALQQARAAADPDAPVRIGYLPITDATPLLVAHAKGLFEAEGLKADKPVLLRSWSQLIEAFLSGQINVVHLLSPMTIWARYGSQAPAKVVAWNHVGGSGITVSPDILEPKQLAGKHVAIPFWYSIHNVMLQYLLRENGLTPVSLGATGKPAANEVNLVVMAPADMIPALASKRIAGFTAAEPFNAQGEALKVNRVLRFTGDMWRDHACCVVYMHERDLAERPEWSQKVVDAMVKAQLWSQNNREETAHILSKDGEQKYMPFPEPVMRRVLAPEAEDWARYAQDGSAQRMNEWDEKRIDFQPYPYPSYTEELVKLLQNTLIEGKNDFLPGLDPQFVARDLVDDRFVKVALEKVGGLTAFGFPETYTRSEAIGA